MREIVLNINAEGRLQFIYTDELQPLLDEGRAGIFRASSVEPDYRGKWTADMSPIFGPMAGPFDSRDEAIEHEVKAINARLAAGEGL